MFDQRLALSRITWACLVMGILVLAALAGLQLAGSEIIPNAQRYAFLMTGLVLLVIVVVLERRSRLTDGLERHLNELLERSPESIVAVDSQGRIVYANAQTSKLFGYDPKELLGKSVDILWPKKDAYADSLPNPPSEMVTQHKEGDQISVQVKSSKSDNGRLNTFFLRDNTKYRQTQETLLQREAFLQMVIRQMPAIIWTTDTKLEITSSMGAGLAAVNLEPNQIIGLTMLENLDRDLESTPIAAHHRAVRGESLSYEMDWKGRTFQVRVDPLRDPRQQITGTIGIVVDVTDKKQTMKELAARERQQAAVAQLGQRALEGLSWERLSQEAVRLIAQTLQIEHAQAFDAAAGQTSPAVRASVGWPHGQNGPAKLAELALGSKEPLLLDDLSRVDTLVSLHKEHELASALATALPGKAGPRGALAVYSKQPKRFSQDDSYFLQAVANVLAAWQERREAEENQNRLVAILEATPDMVGVASVDFTVFYLNRAGRELLGLNSESLDACKLPDFFAEQARLHLVSDHIPTAITRGMCQAESVLRNRAGQDIPISQLLLAHRSPAGAVQFYSIIARDARDRLKLEEQFRQAQKMEAVGRLAGGVAHDFNNLLCVILGHSSLLLQDLSAADPRRDLAQEINKAGERAATLTRQLLAFSRKQMLIPSVLSLNALIANMEIMLRRLIGEDIELRLELDPALHTVKADPGQVEQILMNLAVNARDAMIGGDGVLSIATANAYLEDAGDDGDPRAETRSESGAGAFARITVSDTGCGMDEAVKGHLFEPFFTTKEVGKGTGLGLATVYGIIKQSNGHVDVQSSKGRGTTFHIYLPRVEQETRVEPEAPAVNVTVPKGRETVLLVEDEDGVRALARTVLQAAGYTVMEASDGLHAIELCQEYRGPIHLVVSDVVMPRLSGTNLIKQIAPLHPEMKVMFMSGYSDSALVHYGILSGEVECLLKPFTPDALASKVREVLDRKAPVERRRFARRRLKRSVKGECRQGSGPNLALALLNIAEGGLAILVKDLLDKGELVEVELSAVSASVAREPIKRTAMVVWSLPNGKGAHQVGMRFLTTLKKEDVIAVAGEKL
ncbi:MAG: PAS domain S-box protein [Planctomycetes bacterium]|nr:PAS domain S-box protein [Planctomycetota bacterium]